MEFENAIVPLNPVKLMFLNDPLVVTKFIVSVPALTLTLIAFASPAFPRLIPLVPVLPLYVKLTTGVPVTVSPVAVAVENTVALFPVTVMFPVPNDIDRVLLLDAANVTQVSVLSVSYTHLTLPTKRIV